MKRSPFVHAIAVGFAFAAMCLAGVLSSSLPAQAQVQVRLDIGNAPPPPRLVFVARPHEVYVPSQRVYVVDDPGAGDIDCFRRGGAYWLFRDGYWYRSSSWRRPFVVVQPRAVPAVFYQVPAEHWKHRPAGPPGLAKRGDKGPPGHAGRSGSVPPGQAKKGGPHGGRR